ncbi:MAG: formate transporter [Elusimicrobia bacterium RIFOXYD2_FULL_34_15]|nr:MAG: formate transporter [Elusimicrobia bacterium RIFOXYD2_FULL_34_15]
MTNTPQEIIKNAGNVGEYKSNLKNNNLLLRSFVGGLLIAIGASLSTVVSTGLEIPGIKQLVAGAVFPVGLIILVLTGMELFTGNCMILPVACMQKKIPWIKAFYVCLWTYTGNFIGALFWAYLMSVGPFSKGGTPELTVFGQNAVSISQTKVLSYQLAGLSGLWSAFMKGIACNLLVNLAILLSFTSKEMIGKILGIWFPIMAFVACGFEHSVANMYFIPAGMFLGSNVTWQQFLFWNMMPVTIGNIIGGTVFVGLIYHLSFKNEVCSL